MNFLYIVIVDTWIQDFVTLSTFSLNTKLQNVEKYQPETYGGGRWKQVGVGWPLEGRCHWARYA
jgi:hypothetical protein